MAQNYLSDAAANDFQKMRDNFKKHHANAGGRTTEIIPFDDSEIILRALVSSIISGQGGRYNGKLIGLGVNTNPSGNLSFADLGVADTTEDVEIWNLAEAGLSTESHLIPINTMLNGGPVVVSGPVISYRKDNGKPIIIVNVGVPNGNTSWMLWQMLKDPNTNYLYQGFGPLRMHDNNLP